MSPRHPRIRHSGCSLIGVNDRIDGTCLGHETIAAGPNGSYGVLWTEARHLRIEACREVAEGVSEHCPVLS